MSLENNTKNKKELTNLIRKAAWQGMEILPIKRAKVISVNEIECSIIAVDTAEEKEEYEASLRSVVLDQKDGIIPIPAIGSIVTLGFVNNSEEQPVVLSLSRLDKLIINSNIEIEFIVKNSESGKINIKDNSLSFGKAIEPAVLGNKLFTQLQNIDNTLNALLTWAGTGIKPGPDGGIAPLTGVTHSAVTNDILSETNKLS